MLLLLSGYAGLVLADVVISYGGHVSAKNTRAPAPLTVHNRNIRERCPGGRGTATIRATVNGAKTQGSIHITLPRQCLRRGTGVPLTFNNPGLQFRSLRNMATGMSLKSNPPWTGGTAGTVRTCVSRAGAGCSTTQMVLTSGSGAAPTSVVNIANGRNWGPWVRTTGLTAGETATITLYFYLDWRNTVTGDHAVIQVDQITLIVTQR